MNRHYADILSRIPDAPLWFDENAVPRYEPFSPQLVNIYAREAVLMRIECQSCERSFDVAMSRRYMDIGHNLASDIKTHSIHYGDPPNVECCCAGPTMNSVPRKVLQYWRHIDGVWIRMPELERDIKPEWMEEPSNPPTATRQSEP